jgi:pyruvate-formate lyase-activating enzyme
MIEPLFGRCLYCNNPTTRPGETYHVRCEIMALIELSYRCMTERLHRAGQGRRIVTGIKRQEMTAIQSIEMKGK